MATIKGRINAISVSKRKGTQKINVPEAQLKTDFGIVGDAHAGCARRQVSLLPIESIEKIAAKGIKVSPGNFAENITTEGIDLRLLEVGGKLKLGESVELEITELRKTCHSRCEIFKQIGDCIMPREGVFARVTKPGRIRIGDVIEVINFSHREHRGHREMNYKQCKSVSNYNSMIRTAILTASDSCAQRKREDISGQTIADMLGDDKFEICEKKIVADNYEDISKQLKYLSDKANIDLIFTTGGTGLGPRDVTPEATASVCERTVPGLGEIIRIRGWEKTKSAILSRGIAGIRNNTLIINLPGSPKGVRESLEIILDVLPHAVEMMHGGGH